MITKFGDLPLRKIDSFQIQIWLNGLAEEYSESVVRSCFSNIRSITAMARKQKFLKHDCGEDVAMPQTKAVKKTVMTQGQNLGLVNGIEDMHDLCLLQVEIFCGPRASEVMGLQWKSWTGEALLPLETAYEGKFYGGRLKPNRARCRFRFLSKCGRSSKPLEGLLVRGPDVPHVQKGERKGQAVPRWGKNFLKWRVRPVAQKLGIPDRIVTFHAMRRTLGTDMQQYGTLKDTQGMLRHASIKTTGDVYIQTIEQSVLAAVNSRTSAVLGD